ncbi:MAG: 1-acyl-sn-glycerol-3-phosphate acyltransferase [Synechococcaceae cyanobacterium]|nr:1-acyl-sn-glycerol-3-phosphate acyltransferase [Synechococcaceae cyanobacterium]
MAAGAPLTFLPPRLDARVLGASRLVLPLWLRRQSRIGSVELHDPERLVEALARFQAGDSRLLLAFRHPSLDDAAALAHLLWNLAPREGRALGVSLPRRPHAQFLYDRGIPLWAGDATAWLLSRLGGISIQRGTLDLPALRTARGLLLDGPHPLAVAPEGATNGHNEVMSALEPGTAQLAFWTAEALERDGRPEAMEILPVGLQYSFERPVWGSIEALLSQLEREAGVEADPGPAPGRDGLYGRLVRLGERMLTQLEDFYRTAYRCPLPPPTPLPPGEAANAALAERMGRLLDAALRVVEEGFGLEPRGALGERCRRLEQASWDRLYPGGNGGGAGGEPEACPLQRGLADRLAEETERRMWHMRLVEGFEAVSGSYVRQSPSQERFADTLLLLWDTLCRIRAGNPGRRPRLGRRRLRIPIGAPLPVRERLDAYRRDRRRAVAALTGDLQAALQALIVPEPGTAR